MRKAKLDKKREADLAECEEQIKVLKGLRVYWSRCHDSYGAMKAVAEADVGAALERLNKIEREHRDAPDKLKGVELRMKHQLTRKGKLGVDTTKLTAKVVKLRSRIAQLNLQIELAEASSR